jgi:hypothetical protein
VFWTLVGCASMYLVYGTLTVDPLALPVAEILSCDILERNFVTQFVGRRIRQYRSLMALVEVPKSFNHDQLAAVLRGEEEEKRPFAPKTFEEMEVDIVVGLCRFARYVFTSALRLACSVWSAIGPVSCRFIGRCALWVLPYLLIALIAIFHTLPKRLWYRFTVTNLYQRCRLYVYLVRNGRIPPRPEGRPTPEETRVAHAHSEALRKLCHLSVRDVAVVITENEKLRQQISDMVRKAAPVPQDLPQFLACLSPQRTYFDAFSEYNSKMSELGWHRPFN